MTEAGCVGRWSGSRTQVLQASGQILAQKVPKVGRTESHEIAPTLRLGSPPSQEATLNNRWGVDNQAGTPSSQAVSHHTPSFMSPDTALAHRMAVFALSEHKPSNDGTGGDPWKKGYKERLLPGPGIPPEESLQTDFTSRLLSAGEAAGS